MSSYFFPGYAQDNKPYYGLYNAVANRFVIVDTALEILKRVVIMLSSKCQLYIVELTNTQNYTPTLIDNHCCANWGLSNIDGLDLFTHPRDPDSIIIDCAATLTQNTAAAPAIWQELQQFAFLAHSVAQHWHSTLDWIYRDYYDFISWPESMQKLKDLERSTYHTIYTSQQYLQCEQQIKQLINA
jgi:hypothetical protein